MGTDIIYKLFASYSEFDQLLFFAVFTSRLNSTIASEVIDVSIFHHASYDTIVF